MANSVLNWVWDHSRSKHGSRLVLLALADWAREDGTAWPSVAAIKRKTQLGDRAVQAAITDCVKLGELEVGYQEGPGGCNRYRLLMGRTPANIAPPQKLRGAESAPPQDSRGPKESESPQASEPTPADSAPPANIAPPQISTDPPAESAGGTLIEPSLNSSTKSSIGGPGADPLFDAETQPAKHPRRRKAPASDVDFERWYKTYPVHKARGDAEKAWGQVMRAGADPEVLIAAAERYRQDPQVLRGYGKFPAGWLRAKCWLDEPSAEPNPASGNGYRPYQNPADQSEYDLPMFPPQEAPR